MNEYKQNSLFEGKEMVYGVMVQEKQRFHRKHDAWRDAEIQKIMTELVNAMTKLKCGKVG